MALTVTEAMAVNTLLDYLIGTHKDGRTDARLAAELLADHANKTLSAGLTGAAVQQAWHRVPRRAGEAVS